MLLTWVLMTRTSAGRQLYAMGGNPEAARRLGINIAAMHFLAYGYLGLMAGLAGLLQAHRVGEAVPNAMVGNELNVLAAAVLGGASLTGGIGTVRGVLLGILLLAMLQNGLNLLGVSPYFFQIVIGLVILLSTSITGLSSRAGRAGGRPRQRRRRLAEDVGRRRTAAADRLLHRLRERTPRRHRRPAGLLVALLVFFALLLPGELPDDRHRAVDDVPAAGARPPGAGHGDPADLGRPQPRDHRHRQPVRAADGVDHDQPSSRRSRRRRDRAGRRRRARSPGSPTVHRRSGCVTGVLVATMGVHPILVTLGTKSVIDGVSICLTRGTVVSGFPDSFQWLGNGICEACAGAVPDPARIAASWSASC